MYFDYFRYEVIYVLGRIDVKYFYNLVILNGKDMFDSYENVKEFIRIFKKKYFDKFKVVIIERLNIKVVRNVERVKYDVVFDSKIKIFKFIFK